MHVFTVQDVQYVLNACTYRTNCQLQGTVNVCIHTNRCSVYSAQRETRTYTTKRSVRYGCIHTQYDTVRNDRYVPNARVHRTKCSVMSELKYAQCSVTRYIPSARVQKTKCLVRSRYVSIAQSSRYVLNPCIHKTKGSKCSTRKYPHDKVFSKFNAHTHSSSEFNPCPANVENMVSC